jgi:hypothetical protein
VWAAVRRRGLDQRVVLPRLGVYHDIWKYDLGTLEKDLSAHLVLGTATAAAYSLPTRMSTGGERG